MLFLHSTFQLSLLIFPVLSLVTYAAQQCRPRSLLSGKTHYRQCVLTKRRQNNSCVLYAWPYSDVDDLLLYLVTWRHR